MLARLTNDASRRAGSARSEGQRRGAQVFGWSALAFGVLALALGLLPSWIAPLYDPPSRAITQRATDWVSEIKDKAMAALRAEPALPEPAEQRNFWRDPRIGVSALLFAFAALVLGVVAFVRHEDQRLVACSVALSAGTICAQYFVTALLILAFATLVGVVLARQG